jgi:hypothetical protein
MATQDNLPAETSSHTDRDERRRSDTFSQLLNEMISQRTAALRWMLVALAAFLPIVVATSVYFVRTSVTQSLDPTVERLVAEATELRDANQQLRHNVAITLEVAKSLQSRVAALEDRVDTQSKIIEELSKRRSDSAEESQR